MSATEPGDYIVVITRPDGSLFAWSGYADNRTDALYLTMELIDQEQREAP